MNHPLRIVVLGYNGMLGNAVAKYFGNKKDSYVVLTTSTRWNDEAFKNFLITTECDFIINCIGGIPQKNKKPEDFLSLNKDLPLFLESLGKKVILPSTDCEFSGAIQEGEVYNRDSVRDAEDAYGKSKADISAYLEKNSINTKIIRTSIIGHELNSNVALLDWFLSNKGGEVFGYTDRFWNGITTLQWAKECEYLMHNFDTAFVLTQLGTEECNSKYAVLTLMNEVYKTETSIIPKVSGKTENKCLLSDRKLPTLKEQLEELKTLYER